MTNWIIVGQDHTVFVIPEPLLPRVFHSHNLDSKNLSMKQSCQKETISILVFVSILGGKTSSVFV